MGWINTLLDVGILAAEMNQVNQLNQLKNQGATEEARRVFEKYFLDRIFSYSETARMIIDAEPSNPKAAAGAMRVLELRVDDSHISQELFSKGEDKNIVSDIIYKIHTNSQRMRSQLLPADCEQLEHIAALANRLPEISYYRNGYSDLQSYRAAKKTMEGLGIFSSKAGGTGVGCLGTLVILFLIPAVFANRNTLGLMVILMIGCSIGLIVLLSHKRSQLNQAEKVIKDTENKYDLELLQRLDKEFNGNPDEALKQYEKSEADIRSFFGGSPLLQIQS